MYFNMVKLLYSSDSGVVLVTVDRVCINVNRYGDALV